MLTWVVYDIAKDKTRTKIAKRCLNFGLYRGNFSITLGPLQWPTRRVLVPRGPFLSAFPGPVP